MMLLPGDQKKCIQESARAEWASYSRGEDESTI